MSKLLSQGLKKKYIDSNQLIDSRKREYKNTQMVIIQRKMTKQESKKAWDYSVPGKNTDENG